MDNGAARFRRSFIGYDRSAVDQEFEKLLNQVDEALDQNDELRKEIRELKDERRELETTKRAMEDERTAMSRERATMAESYTSITGRVAELQNSLTSAQVTNEALQHKIDATVSERNEMQMRLDTVQERNNELTMRERQFDEIEKSVSSIMSVTKRATDRLFQKTVENQANVIRIAGDAAQEAAMIRADLTAARDDMNLAFDEFQDRIDRIDASLTGAVHKLVAIKHDNGLKNQNGDTSIESEVERLLSLRAGEVDYSDGKGYAVPVLGPYSTKFISDAAKKVNSGEMEGHPANEHYEDNKASNDDEHHNIEVRKSFPGIFKSTDDSIREANKLLDAADRASEQANTATNNPAPSYTAAPTPNPTPTYIPYQIQQNFTQQRVNPIGFESKLDSNEDEDFEKVDLTSLNADTAQMPYSQPQVIEQQAATSYMPPVTQNYAGAEAMSGSYQFAGMQPSFIPDAVPVVSVDAVQDEPTESSEEVSEIPSRPRGKRVSVNKRYGRENDKVRIFVRHGK